MARDTQTSAIIDGLLRLAAGGTVLTIGLVAPGVIQALDKPLQKYFAKLDKQARERELERLLGYMRRQGLVSHKPQDYEHGLEITLAGIARLKKRDSDTQRIAVPQVWDQRWRLIFFDIPELQKKARNNFTYGLRRLGIQQLQQSVWVHPFPCRDEIAILALENGITKFVTYVETTHIDHEALLRQRFSRILQTVPVRGRSYI